MDAQDPDSPVFEADVFREIYHAVYDAIFVHDPASNDILDVNETACELYGYDRHEMRQLSVRDLSADIQPHTDTTAGEYLQRAVDGDPQVFDWLAVDSDGTQFWVEVSMRAATVEAEPRVLVIVRDISDRKRTEQELRQLNEEYGAVFEHAADGIFLIDVEYDGSEPVFRFERLNPAHEGTSGMSTDEIRGKTPREALGDAVGAEVAANYRRCVEAREPITYEEVLPMPEGDIVWQTSLAPVIVNDTVTRIVGIARDVTERKEYEQRLERANEQLRILNRIVRHDIRTDMNITVGWSEELERHVDAEGRDILDRIHKTGHHVIALTQTVRDFVTAVGSDERTPIQPVDLRDQLLDELDRRRSTYPDATFTVAGEIPSVQVRANDLLSSVFRNILNNAVQHNDTPDPHVDIEVTEDADSVTVRIADDGPGIPDTQKPTIFGRGEEGLDDPAAGIGLYLVDTLVDEYGGDVWVEDNTPRGAVFGVELRKST